MSQDICNRYWNQNRYFYSVAYRRFSLMIKWIRRDLWLLLIILHLVIFDFLEVLDDVFFNFENVSIKIFAT